MPAHYYSQSLTWSALQGLITKIIEGYYPDLEFIWAKKQPHVDPTFYSIAYVWHSERGTVPIHIRVELVSERQVVYISSRKNKELRVSADDYNRAHVRRQIELLRHQFLTYYDDRLRKLGQRAMLEGFLPQISAGREGTVFDTIGDQIMEAISTGETGRLDVSRMLTEGER